MNKTASPSTNNIVRKVVTAAQITEKAVMCTCNARNNENDFRNLEVADLVLNLKQEKIDGILMDMGFYAPLTWEDDDLSFIEMDMPVTEYGVAFPKDADADALKAQIDEYIKAMKESGFSEQEIKAYLDDAMSSDYDHLLAVSVEMVDKCNERVAE